MVNDIKIKRKGFLHKVLREDNFDQIVFWKNGSWTDVSTSYGGEQDGNNPIYRLKRVYFYDVTWRMATEKIKEIEEFINSYKEERYT
jgi:hypothetical protein